MAVERLKITVTKGLRSSCPDTRCPETAAAGGSPLNSQAPWFPWERGSSPSSSSPRASSFPASSPSSPESPSVNSQCCLSLVPERGCGLTPTHIISHVPGPGVPSLCGDTSRARLCGFPRAPSCSTCSLWLISLTSLSPSEGGRPCIETKAALPPSSRVPGAGRLPQKPFCPVAGISCLPSSAPLGGRPGACRKCHGGSSL